MHDRGREHDEGQHEHRPHPVEADEQAADDRRDEERHPGRPCRPGRSRGPGPGPGTSRVTSVGTAMLRRFPVMIPAMSSTTSTHSSGSDGSRNVPAGASRYSARHDGVDRERGRRRGLHDRDLAVVVDEAAEPDPGQGGGAEEQAGDQPGREDRPGLQVDPERHREEDGEVDHRDHQAADEHVGERRAAAARAGRAADPPARASPGGRRPGRLGRGDRHAGASSRPGGRSARHGEVDRDVLRESSPPGAAADNGIAAGSPAGDALRPGQPPGEVLGGEPGDLRGVVEPGQVAAVREHDEVGVGQRRPQPLGDVRRRRRCRRRPRPAASAA